MESFTLSTDVLLWHPDDYDSPKLRATCIDYIVENYTGQHTPLLEATMIVNNIFDLCEAHPPQLNEDGELEGSPHPLIVVAQICHETGNLNYGGDVSPEQWNYAGLGAIGGGKQGYKFPSVFSGCLAVWLHHYVYINGDRFQWRPNVSKLLQINMYIINLDDRNESNILSDPRYNAVLSVRKEGTVRQIRDYGTRWAPSPKYSEGILKHLNRIIAIYNEEEDYLVEVIIAAGHHNTSGGNALEHELVGELTETIARVLQGRKILTHVITPDGPDEDHFPGDGDYPGSLSAVAQEMVNKYPHADYYFEIHTEGAGGREGAFGIYPEWVVNGDHDFDAFAKQQFIPLFIHRLDDLTDIGVRGDGTMSERSTDVGGQGFRLGFFRITYPVKEQVTRIMFELGAHDAEEDLQVIRGENYGFFCGRALAETLEEFHQSHPGAKTYDDIFNEIYGITLEPSFPPFHAPTGRSVAEVFLPRWYSLTTPVQVFGYPLTNPFEVDTDEVSGTVQIFDKASMVYDPDMPEEWQIRTLAPWEATRIAIAYARMMEDQ